MRTSKRQSHTRISQPIASLPEVGARHPRILIFWSKLRGTWPYGTVMPLNFAFSDPYPDSAVPVSARPAVQAWRAVSWARQGETING